VSGAILPIKNLLLQIYKGILKMPTVCTLLVPMKSKNNNNDDDDDDNNNNNNNNTAMGSVHARGDTILTFGLKALTETNTSRLATATQHDR
jgi:hypothetical protein